ncbi:SDR family NAD(P)-dependent oxidoreductase [Brevibacillus sp. NRS-1366]|uniref:SDR family NAD(P)-dependent oxidoreductase n=1 Tax=Brevibacillus sp. NRS-1366 TaxID=3233899 RepID=UPI003D2161DB
MAKLTNQIAFITGGGRGIGRSIAELLGKEGAHVIVTDIDLAGAQSVANEIEQKGGKAASLALDVSQSSQVAAVMNQVVEKFGRIDILVNNAGIAGNPKWVDEISDQEWTRMFDIHVNGSFYCLREAAKVMKKNRYGRIVNLSSCAAVTGLAGLSHYAAAKYAIVGLTETAAMELGVYNITVNAIKPGVIRTALTDGFLELAGSVLTDATPVRRLGDPIDVARLVTALVSPEFGFVTGCSYIVDGGFHLVTEMDKTMLKMLS